MLNHKASSFALALTLSTLFSVGLIGCAAPTGSPSDPEDTIAESESDLTSSDLIGEYEPYSKADDNGEFASVKVKRVGGKLKVEVDAYGVITLDTTRTSSGAYLFQSEIIKDDCDDPGCSFLESFYGLVYFKNVDGKKIPTVKLNTVVNHLHPESDEGEEIDAYYEEDTLRWKKIGWDKK